MRWSTTPWGKTGRILPLHQPPIWLLWWLSWKTTLSIPGPLLSYRPRGFRTQLDSASQIIPALPAP